MQVVQDSSRRYSSDTVLKSRNYSTVYLCTRVRCTGFWVATGLPYCKAVTKAARGVLITARYFPKKRFFSLLLYFVSLFRRRRVGWCRTVQYVFKHVSVQFSMAIFVMPACYSMRDLSVYARSRHQIARFAPSSLPEGHGSQTVQLRVQRATTCIEERGGVKLETCAQLSEAGSYTSTVPRSPLSPCPPKT